jgi:hypothetical protein
MDQFDTYTSYLMITSINGKQTPDKTRTPITYKVLPGRLVKAVDQEIRRMLEGLYDAI